MKIAILLLTVAIHFNFTSAHFRGHIPPIEHFEIPAGSTIYVQIPGERVQSGILNYMRGRPIPSWIFPPYQGTQSESSIYVQTLNRDGLTAHLEPVHELLFYHGEDFACYIHLPNNVILEAFLHPIEQHRPAPVGIRAFLRVGRHNYSVHTGVFHRRLGYRPPYIL